MYSHRPRTGTIEAEIHEAGSVRLLSFMPSLHSRGNVANQNHFRDGNGMIDRDEFFQIQQIANNPLATRLMAIFDEE